MSRAANFAARMAFDNDRPVRRSDRMPALGRFAPLLAHGIT